MCRITIDNSASTTECTGLVPFAEQNPFEYNPYSDIMEFFPEDIIERK